MRKITLLLILFVVNLFSSSKIDEFIRGLNANEREDLENFCNRLLGSFAGYVLFGDKPLCIESVRNFGVPSIFCDKSCVVEMQGVAFFRKLSNQNTNKKFPVIVCDIEGSSLLVFINREAFLKVVDENIALFKYILGRTLTSDSLLNELLSNGKQFYDILKNNKLLLGILLGYGTQNALVGSREEDLLGELGESRNIFPFRNYRSFIQSQHSPSLGFATLENEYQALHDSLKLSTEIKSFKECSIPHFACIPDSEETLQLLAKYENNRKSIIEVLKGGNCLSRILERLFINTSNDLSILLHENPRQFIPSEKVFIPKFMACLDAELNYRNKNSAVSKNEAVEWFLHGVKCHDAGGAIQCQADFYPDVIDSYISLKKSNHIMSKLSEKSNIIQLIPKYLYYKVLLQGKGNPATKMERATFQFSLYDLNGQLVDCGTIKNIELNNIMPGISNALLGMKRKEERRVYIHPKLCYGLLPDALPVRVDIQLIDFEEGNEENTLFPPIELSMRNFEPVDIAAAEEDPDYFLKGPFLKEPADFLPFILRHKKQLKNSYIKFGYDCCAKLRKAGIKFDVKELVRHFHSPENGKNFKNQEEMSQFILEMNSYIFSLSKLNSSL
ncbi:MAG: FKBP-type peptidyl-prolyl cis-trans isomerase [Parachlamydiales bacterium]|nr:FKBP-type peptidyl-prolyl cis-trans isomerase [Parachlamydiales bacterium]